MRLLVVEDEPDLLVLMGRALERGGFVVDIASDLAQAAECLAVARYDIMILDLNLPDGDGLSLLRQLRARGSQLPVLVLTARDAVEDRVTGLDTGADDYLVKPFHIPELIARIRALLRRPDAALGITLSLGNLVLDTTSRQVSVNAAAVAMSVREVALLELLMRRQGAVVPRDVMEQGLYSFEAELGSNAMEVLVHRVRRKLAGSADGDRQMVRILTAVLSDGLPAVEAASQAALREATHSADVILNILSRHREPAPPATILTPDALQLRHAPVADCSRYDTLRRTM